MNAEQMIKQMQEVLEKLGPPLPVIKPSPLVAKGQVIRIPADHTLALTFDPKQELWFVNPEDYHKYVEEIE